MLASEHFKLPGFFTFGDEIELLNNSIVADHQIVLDEGYVLRTVQFVREVKFERLKGVVREGREGVGISEDQNCKVKGEPEVGDGAFALDVLLLGKYLFLIGLIPPQLIILHTIHPITNTSNIGELAAQFASFVGGEPFSRWFIQEIQGTHQPFPTDNFQHKYMTSHLNCLRHKGELQTLTLPILPHAQSPIIEHLQLRQSISG